MKSDSKYNQSVFLLNNASKINHLQTGRGILKVLGFLWPFLVIKFLTLVKKG